MAFLSSVATAAFYMRTHIIYRLHVLRELFSHYIFEHSTVVAKNKKCHGGGALVAVSSTYCSKRRLGCVYVPTWSDVDTWSELDKSLQLVYNAMNPDCDCVLLCGDFNRRDIECTPANNQVGLMPHSWTNPQTEQCVEMYE